MRQRPLLDIAAAWRTRQLLQHSTAWLMQQQLPGAHVWRKATCRMTQQMGRASVSAQIALERCTAFAA